MANKIEEARRSGIAYALKILLDAENDGKSAEEAIEKLKDELKFRNITKAPLMIPRSEIDRFCKEVKENCVLTVECVALMALHDEFDFGQKRLEQFGNRFTEKTECICEDYATWKDYADILMDECHIKLKLPESFISRENVEE